MKRFVLMFLAILTLSIFSNSVSSSVYAEEPCTWKDCISSDGFEISVWAITPGTAMTGTGGVDGTKWSVGQFLATILEKLIIIFWVLSILIMTVGAWYMIIYHGQDEFLSKWKSIFVSGLIALAVALSAGVIVRLFAYLLYSTT